MRLQARLVEVPSTTHRDLGVRSWRDIDVDASNLSRAAVLAADL